MADPVSAVSDPYGLLLRSFQIDPYPTYARLREEAPVYFSEGWGGWVLTRYQDVLAGFRDARLSSNRAAAFSAALPAPLREKMAPVTENLGAWTVLLDPPDHTRIRSLLNVAFTPRLSEYLRPRVQALVDELLDKVQGAGQMDVVHDFASPLPVAVIGDMLGLPREGTQRLKVWSDAFAAFLGTPQLTPELLGRMRTSVVEMEAYFRDVIAHRRNHLGPDLLSTMISAEEQGKILSERELLSTCSMLLFGGHETTTHLICNGVELLMHHPDQVAAMQESREAAATAVEEFLRYESPLQRLTRVAREDMEMGGRRIQKGQKVYLSTGAANRDENQFPNADRLDVRRRENRHIAFGFGIHYCLGATLARLEGELALTSVFRRFRRIEPQGGTPERLDNVAFRGFRSLPVLVA